ncbi:MULTISPECIES: hypothetical protein [Brenneria]|uniref:Uncharacterized protein n=1 Tax=Brenneria nigrifluens DSM 30175 = ATCC 13028 TaxID=1121120 RepID=A0A2U1UBL6_9GAMM|nr:MULTISPECIES: hypothetical protein [Brenneria]EHD21315.1 putative prophage exported protein [Brenneria sp. EniD312]PWC19053.1 hypothetical protein DDT54_22590 [Brenneria nigrifluens DSM 30175 = ATCC 13028]QCR04449.1 hypothetical protein EH206_09850 [Brenneria nigrifluens DSM 30175 = ATCC 13028]
MSNKFSFAHLLGRSASAKVEEDDEKEESKKSKARKAENEEDKKDAEEDDTDAKEDEKDDPDAEEDDDEKDAEDDDDGDDEDDSKAKKAGRRAERQRCAKIFGSKYAAANPALAASLAFNTGMSSKAAIQVMASSGTSPAPARVTLDQRMASVKNHQLGVDAKPVDKSTKAGLAASMSSLYSKTKGVK